MFQLFFPQHNALLLHAESRINVAESQQFVAIAWAWNAG